MEGSQQAADFFALAAVGSGNQELCRIIYNIYHIIDEKLTSNNAYAIIFTLDYIFIKDNRP